MAKRKPPQPEPHEHHEPEQYHPHWNFYFIEKNGQPASIYLDLNLTQLAPIKGEKYLIDFTLQLQNPDENGLPTSAEEDTIFEIEDAFMEKIEENCIFAGRITTEGQRKYFFYTADFQTVIDSITESMEKFPDYDYEIKTSEDKKWETYFEELYPDPLNLQLILNRSVLDNLLQHGDTLEKSRNVRHWIYFETEKDREKFAKVIEKEGFTLKNLKKENDEYGLMIERIDHIDPESIDQLVVDLWDLANEHQGDYDGWETEVVK